MPATQMIARLPLDQLGGARVFRPCTIAGQHYARGAPVPAEVLCRVPRANLKAMIDQTFLVVWPAAPDAATALREDEEVFIYQRIGTNTCDVVVGRKLNARPLSRAEAEHLAASHRAPAASAA